MKAAVRDRYGPPDVVEVRDIERPTPTEGQVLVRVRAASVNRADLDGLKPRPGFMRLFMGLRAPRHRRIGVDAAGVVEEVGAGVTRLRSGDEVMGDMFVGAHGSFAEYVCAPERAFASIPERMSFDEASTLPHSAILALQGLRHRDGRTIKAGDRVLVDGASGNVGPFAVQIAKAMGAEVTGVASTEKLGLVQLLGADHVIDYTQVDYTTTGERYDWILDTDTHHPIGSVRRALRPNGVYVTLGGETADILAGLVAGPLRSRFSDRWSGLMLWWKPMHPPDVERLKELIAAGQLRPVIDRRYPLDRVVEALRRVDEGRARGKVVVTMDAPAAPEELSTQRLILRSPRDADAPAILEIHADPRACAHNPSDALATAQEAEALLARWQEHWGRHGFGYWVVERASGASGPIGFCGLKRMRLHERPVLNLFYRLHPSAWGQGIATEAATEVVAWARAAHPDEPIVARVRPENAASHRVAMRAGLQRMPQLDTSGEDGPDWIYAVNWAS